jgi:osmotically inducible protein OsmC
VPRVERSASVVWEGSSAKGTGRITAATGAFVELPYSEPTRVSLPEGQTSPEELLAAAHAACYGMSLATELTRLRKPPARLDVEATTTLDEVEGKGHVIVASALAVRASANGLSDEELQAAARAADEGCTFSKLIRASAVVTVAATIGEG